MISKYIFTAIILTFILAACTDDSKVPEKPKTDEELQEMLSPEEYSIYKEAQQRYASEQKLDELNKLKIDSVIKEQREINKEKLEEEVHKQIEHLQKIIENNKQKIEAYKVKIASGDTSELPGLKQYVQDLKESVKRKEERLNQLRKKEE